MFQDASNPAIEVNTSARLQRLILKRRSDSNQIARFRKGGSEQFKGASWVRHNLSDQRAVLGIDHKNLAGVLQVGRSGGFTDEQFSPGDDHIGTKGRIARLRCFDSLHLVGRQIQNRNGKA